MERRFNIEQQFQLLSGEKKNTKMGENKGKNPIEKGMDWTCVLALEAPSLSGSSARPRRPRKMKARADEPKHEGLLADSLIINPGEDVGEKVLSYFRNSTNNSVSSHGRMQTGIILSATGSVLHPIMDTENSSASDKGSFSIIKLGGKYIISDDGQVQQEGPLTILCAGSSGVAVGGQVNGRLVAEDLVQVLVGRFCA